MKIMALKVENLVNNKHFTFMQFVLAATGQFSILETLFGVQIAALRSAFEEEDEVHMRHNRSFLTPDVQKAEEARDARFRYVHDAIRLATQDVDGAKAADALFLAGIVKDYGGIGIARMPVDAESGALTNLATDLLQKYADRVASLGLTAAVERMQEANDRYIHLSAERTWDESQNDKQAMARARRGTDRAYRGLVDSINLYVQYRGDGELLPFIKYLNAEIERYRIQIGQGVGSTEEDGEGTGSGEGSEGSEGSGSGVFRTATFRFANGNTIGLRVEVGTPLTAPANTPGYVWRPVVPELMPRGNRSFHEVPEEIPVATATFHFADHREETVTAEAGTELTAPTNTPGYYWFPEVPAVMPTEDTTYHELRLLLEPTWPEIDPDSEREFTATFLNSEDMEEIEVIRGRYGTPLTPPQAPEGTIWPRNLPTTMPYGDFVTRNIPADSPTEPLYKLEYKDGDEVLRTDYLPVNSIIIRYPLPDDKMWTHFPHRGLTPAQDWAVVAGEE